MVHFSMLGVAHNVDAVVIVEHEDVGDDRRRHQDDMRGGRHLGHGSRLGHGGRQQGRRRSVDCGVGRLCATTAFAIQPYLMHMSIILTQRAERVLADGAFKLRKIIERLRLYI